MSKMKISQCARVLNHMLNFGGITSMQAFKAYGITRLSARIHDLEKAGFEISHEVVVQDDGIHYTRYKLKKEYSLGDYIKNRVAKELG